MVECLPLTCKMNCVNIQHNYVKMRPIQCIIIISFNKKHNYVNMQHLLYVDRFMLHADIYKSHVNINKQHVNILINVACYYDFIIYCMQKADVCSPNEHIQKNLVIINQNCYIRCKSNNYIMLRLPLRLVGVIYFQLTMYVCIFVYLFVIRYFPWIFLAFFIALFLLVSFEE